MAHSDVRIVAAGGLEKFAQSGATDAARGTKLLSAIGMLANGDHLILGPGLYDVGAQPVEPTASNVVIGGSGLRTTILGQPASTNPVFRPVGSDIELRDVSISATAAAASPSDRPLRSRVAIGLSRGPCTCPALVRRSTP